MTFSIDELEHNELLVEHERAVRNAISYASHTPRPDAEIPYWRLSTALTEQAEAFERAAVATRKMLEFLSSHPNFRQET